MDTDWLRKCKYCVCYKAENNTYNITHRIGQINAKTQMH